MQQRWWLVAAGIVGIGLAVLLFPKPDTGDEIPDPTPGKVDFNATPEEAAGGAVVDEKNVAAREPGLRRMSPADRGQGLTPPVANVDPRDADRVRRGPSPMAIENVRMRSRPDAVFAGRAAGPLSLIRRQLLLMGTDSSKDLGEQMAGLVSALREQRRDPRTHDFDVLRQQMVEVATEVRGNGDFMSDPQIDQSIARLDEVLAEYDEAAAKTNPED